MAVTRLRGRVRVDGDVEVTGDIVVGDRSLTERLEELERRLETLEGPDTETA